MTLDETTAPMHVAAQTSPAALLTYQELAVWLNDSVRHLRRLVDEEQIPYLKIGRFVRFDQREILEWLRANHRGSRPGLGSRLRTGRSRRR
jgi:excisionase family DNA binding protein